jgi:hypothetical protein
MNFLFFVLRKNLVYFEVGRRSLVSPGNEWEMSATSHLLVFPHALGLVPISIYSSFALGARG